MDRVSFLFNKFLNFLFKILFLITIFEGIIYLFASRITYFSLISLSLFILLGLVIKYALKNNVRKSLIIVGLFLIALGIRLLYFYSIDSIPIGDFNRMFISAGEFLNGDTYMFKGISYFARFPHMTITVLYFALIRKIFLNPLIAIKVINIILSMCNIVLIYYISREVFQDENKNIWVVFLSATYPPMIIYNNVYCSENLAIPFLLLSILMFLKSFNIKDFKAKNIFILLSGIFLSLTQFFRPIGYVMTIAYIIYIFIYFKEKLKRKMLLVCLITISFVIPFVGVSNILIKLNITENQLWHGAEPPSVSILKGTNIKSKGRWNKEDSDIFNKYNGIYEKVDKEAKKIIIERLRKTPTIYLIKFYILKYGTQWSSGDFAGTYWSECGLDEAYNKDYYLNIMGLNKGKMLLRLSKDGGFYIHSFFIILIILSYIGLYKNKKDINYKVDLFYIIFCGVSIQCLITEFQTRYAYPFSWIFIIFAMTAFKDFELIDRKCKDV